MLYIILTLFGVAFALYLLSFAMKDRFKDLEEQVEQLSMTTMQESYQLKKKMRILEEELLVDDVSTTMYSGAQATQKSSKHQTNPTSTSQAYQPPLVQKVLHMYEKGYTTRDIAQETSLKEHDILTTLQQYSSKGS
ncbi:hypothetical protein [Pontibacillus yanchengensis]|uniref:Resolvase HTH domain-containing protein n=1 Tax=Pontibacillus yanchengensis Y32 TaxID=1385514 RepID=A0A0A2TFU7_9BACI|nr:hypothetical protein [Pontibacillus yanchengensis]KGP72971.1 hypothetical protein N782_08685 [Pontibacillus yanchengensis Y32]